MSWFLDPPTTADPKQKNVFIFLLPFKIFISDVSLCPSLPTHPTHPLSSLLPFLCCIQSVIQRWRNAWCPGSVFEIRMQSRTVYTSRNRISCRAGTLSRCQKASKATRHLVQSPRGCHSLPLLRRRWSLSFSVYLTLSPIKKESEEGRDFKKETQSRGVNNNF